MSVVYDVTAEQTVVQGVALWLTRPKPRSTRFSKISIPKTRVFYGKSDLRTRITLLGTTCCGKTIYLVGMYAAMQEAASEFTLTTNDPNDHKRLIEKWNCLFEDGLARWPISTAFIDDYSFILNYQCQPIMTFDYIDYRGGALIDRSTQSDTQKLFEYVEESDCLFLCVSGEYLKQAIVEENGEVNFSVGQKVATRLRLGSIYKAIMPLQQKLNPTNSNPFPVAIVITKYDLCMERGKDAIVQDIRQLFEPLFQPDSGWLVMICPVSLGKELATNQDSGEIELINCQYPLLFAAFSLFRKRYLSEHKENEKKYLKLLAQELEDLPIYLGGEEVSLYV